MNTQFTISVFTEDQIGLLNRVSIIFTRRHINIESITASESEIKGVHRYTIVVSEEEALVIKVVQQLDKQVDVVKAFYHNNDEIVYQEIAMYKVPTSILAGVHVVEDLVRAHGARILTIEPEFTIIELVGYKEETQKLYEVLAPHGVLEFVRSGRVAISKPMKELKTYMKEIEAAAGNK
jgi:acetolactate synthase-1/3 small subunit